MKAPLDYAKPGSGDVRLAVSRKKATGPGKRLGSLLVNPGGPGGSAVGYLQAYAGIGYPARCPCPLRHGRGRPAGGGPQRARRMPQRPRRWTRTRRRTQPRTTAGRRTELVDAFKKFAEGCERALARSAAARLHGRGGP